MKRLFSKRKTKHKQSRVQHGTNNEENPQTRWQSAGQLRDETNQIRSAEFMKR